MFDLLRSHIEKRIHLTEAEFSLSARYFVPRMVRKRQFLLQEGDVCKHLAFVASGFLREYTVDHKGDEHILQFAARDWWISDLNSYLAGTPTTHNIDALQDSEVFLLETSAREKLFVAVPKMERFFRLLLEANYVATHKRITESLSASAEERYLAFMQMYPQMVEEIPQNQIASYLGITPQSLSRIRKELTQKKRRD
jgi:CRP-like cAMP-binding protein